LSLEPEQVSLAAVESRKQVDSRFDVVRQRL
jgi:hypothetical protein